MSRARLFLPLVVFLGLGAFLFRGLSLDPTALPSALVNRPLPEFRLQSLDSGEELARDDVVGETMLVNVWATWCYSCRVEHSFLLELAGRGVKILGLNYKDESAAAVDWLTELGDPYAVSVADTEGILGLDMGVYGAPETYVVDAEGIVRYRHVGVLDAEVWDRDMAVWFPTEDPTL
ncbi:MAG: DsbE family thiol:disulfide interchange protein [Cellvibrionales bacterium]|jgi:cytochrome c biogenesis protein CcmG/thiol:disulfide interchange protein DsbE